MRPYTFFKHDGSAHPPLFELAEFETDAEARAFAIKLLKESQQYQFIEVWAELDDPRSFIVTRASRRLTIVRSAPPAAPTAH